MHQSYDENSPMYYQRSSSSSVVTGGSSRKDRENTSQTTQYNFADDVTLPIGNTSSAIGGVNGNNNRALSTICFLVLTMLVGCYFITELVVSSLHGDLFLSQVNTERARSGNRLDQAIRDKIVSSGNSVVKSEIIIHEEVNNKKKVKSNKRNKENKADLAVDCTGNPYKKNVLHKAFEIPFGAIFRDNLGQHTFEASGLIQVGNGHNYTFYSVFDNMWSIAKFHADTLSPFKKENILIGGPTNHYNKDSNNTHKTISEIESSDFEGIFHYNNTFYLLRESIQFCGDFQKCENGGTQHINRMLKKKKKDDKKKDKHTKAGNKNENITYHAVIEEIIINEDETDYEVIQSCPTEFSFEGPNNGFKGGIIGFMPNDESDGNELILLGLCKGNHCSEEFRHDRGNGRVIAMRKTTFTSQEETSGLKCIWKTIREIPIPKSANFLDYSSITVTASTGKVAISSQEDSQIWIGKLLGIDSTGNGRLNVTAAEFVEDSNSEVSYFPMSNDCQIEYCNIEGIQLLGENMLMAVSDKTKSSQHFRCLQKEQSVHVFVLP